MRRVELSRRYLFLILLFSSAVLVAGQDPPFNLKDSRTSFVENKGQVCNQLGMPRPDVLFYGATNGLAYHFQKNGISYQFSKIFTWKKIEDQRPWVDQRVADSSMVYRVDIRWLSANPSTILEGEFPIEGYDNFYFPHCPNGVSNVRNFKSVLFKDLYKGIDLRYYESGDNLKYDYYVKPHAGYKQIKSLISGATSVELSPEGYVLIKTPLGILEEAPPKVLQNDHELASRWLLSGDTLSFDIDGYDPRLSMVIDPIVRQWSTCYGDAGDDDLCSVSRDPSGNIYGCGTTTSSLSIATNGAHQSVFAGGINSTGDAFIVKFNSSGVRQWATYYGGYGTESGRSCAVDAVGNVYLTGYSNTGYAGNGGTVIATPGSYISTYTTGNTGYLVMFANNGLRKWGTHTYGSPLYCVTDLNNDVYIAGEFNNNFTGGGAASFPTSGAHQTVYGGGQDGFITKFDSSGTRLFSTFYGGGGNELISGLAIDISNNLYACGHGWTQAGTAIATPGSHQFTYGGWNSDAFLVKFHSSGMRLWGTYYGATDYDYAWGVCTDPAGNVYLSGTHQNTLFPHTGTAIATPSSHQPAYGGGHNDGFLAKFNGAGQRQWATYFGGSNTEDGSVCAADIHGNVYLCGLTTSTNNISTVNGYQANYGGGSPDAYLAKFDNNGIRQWGTYYGNSGYSYAYMCLADSLSNIYMVGGCNNASGMTSSGAHQASYGGGFLDGYLVKFSECFTPATPTNVSSVAGTSICSGSHATITAQSNGNIVWFSSATSTNPVGYGATIIIPGLAAGTYTYYAEASLCRDSVNSLRTPVTITVSTHISPTLSANSGSICSGQSFTIIPSGAVSYTIAGGSFVVSPYYTTPYMIAGTSSAGCVSYSSGLTTITVSPSPTITGNGGYLCRGFAHTITPQGASTYTISGNNYIVTPTVNASYSITGTGSAGCPSTNTAIITITVIPTPSLAASGGSICTGASLNLGYTITLVSTGGALYVSPVNNTQVSPSVTTVYTLTLLDWGNGCTDVETVTVVVSNPSPITVNSGTICPGTSFSIVPSGAPTYSFQGGSAVVSPTSTTIYTVTGTGSLGCVSPPVSSTVTVLPAPLITVNSGSICAGDAFTIVPLGANTHTISGGSYTVTPTTTTIYTITGTGTGVCPNAISASATVVVNPLPVVSVNSGTVCAGQNFTVVASGAQNYTYSAGPHLVNLTAGTSYSVTGSSSKGCISVASGSVLVNPLPTVTVNSGTICGGDSFTIVPQGAFSYWVTGAALVVSPLSTTHYSITGMSAQGCISQGAGVSTVSVVATPSVSVNSGSICEGQSFTISPAGATSYSVSGGTYVVSPSSTTVYTLTGVNASFCPAGSPVHATVLVHPAAQVSVANGMICYGQSFTVSPSGGGSYTFTPGPFFNNLTSTTTFSVIGKNSYGCTSTTPAIGTIYVIPLPYISLAGGTVCSGQSFTLSPQGASTYTFLAGGPVVTPTITTSYQVIGQNSAGCTSSLTAHAQITVHAVPILSATYAPVSLCEGELFKVDATGASSYTINGTAFSQTTSIVAQKNNVYTITGVNVFGCMSSSVLAVSVEDCTELTDNTAHGDLIKFYPNPHHSEFMIESVEPVEFKLFNNLGQLILDKKISVGLNMVSTVTLAQGVYTLHYKAIKKSGVFKFVKE